jgi:hypothetical protein
MFGFGKSDEVYYSPSKDGMWVLRDLLEFLIADKRIRLFDGEEFVDPIAMLKDPDSAEFLEIIVLWNDIGIFDYYVRSSDPLFSFGLPCTACGRYVKIPLVRKVKPQDFCTCMGKFGV